MAQLPLGAAPPVPTAPSQDSFAILPKGWYPAMITETDVKETKNGNGSYMSLTAEIVDGVAKGRKVWSNINLKNTNAKAVEIGMRQLGDLAYACQIPDLTGLDTAHFHNKPIYIQLRIEKGTGQYDDKNGINGFRRWGDADVVLVTDISMAATAGPQPVAAPAGPPMAPAAAPAPVAAAPSAPPAAPAVAVAPPPVAPPPVAAVAAAPIAPPVAAAPPVAPPPAPAATDAASPPWGGAQ